MYLHVLICTQRDSNIVNLNALRYTIFMALNLFFKRFYPPIVPLIINCSEHKSHHRHLPFGHCCPFTCLMPFSAIKFKMGTKSSDERFDTFRLTLKRFNGEGYFETIMRCNLCSSCEQKIVSSSIDQPL